MLRVSQRGSPTLQFLYPPKPTSPTRGPSNWVNRCSHSSLTISCFDGSDTRSWRIKTFFCLTEQMKAHTKQRQNFTHKKWKAFIIAAAQVNLQGNWNLCLVREEKIQANTYGPSGCGQQPPDWSQSVRGLGACPLGHLTPKASTLGCRVATWAFRRVFITKEPQISLSRHPILLLLNIFPENISPGPCCPVTFSACSQFIPNFIIILLFIYIYWAGAWLFNKKLSNSDSKVNQNFKCSLT